MPHPQGHQEGGELSVDMPGWGWGLWGHAEEGFLHTSLCLGKGILLGKMTLPLFQQSNHHGKQLNKHLLSSLCEHKTHTQSSKFWGPLEARTLHHVIPIC